MVEQLIQFDITFIYNSNFLLLVFIITIDNISLRNICRTISVSYFNCIWISVDKIVTTVGTISEKLGLNPASIRTGFHWPPFNTVDHLHLHVISPIENMNIMKKIMFNPNSYWFVSVSKFMILYECVVKIFTTLSFFLLQANYVKSRLENYK